MHANALFRRKNEDGSEPAGCVAAAAVMHRVIDVAGARVGAIVSGGNVDLDLFGQFVRSAKQFS